MVGAAALAVAGIREIDGQVHLVALIIGTAALGALGYHAKDCPVNCPGTDALGHPRDPQPEPTPTLPGLPLSLLALCLVPLALLPACTLVNASTHRTDATATAPATEESRVLGFTLLDSSQALTKASAHSGYATNGTWAPGVNMSGLSQTSSSTGLVNAVTVIVNAVAPAVAAVPK